MIKKYILTNETKEICGRTVHRIKAIRSFLGINVGDLGGWVEKESNLSHFGNCWIYDDACAFDNAKIRGNASLYNKCAVFEDAIVKGNSKIKDEANVYGHAKICKNSQIHDKCHIRGYTEINGAIIDGKVCTSQGSLIILGNGSIGINSRLNVNDY